MDDLVVIDSKMKHATMFHRSYNDLGSEFVIEHERLNAKSWLLSFIITIFMSLTILKMHLWDTSTLLGCLLLLLVLLMYRLYTKIKSERLLVLPSLGVQLSTEYFLGHKDINFIPSHRIKDIVINEAVTMCFAPLLQQRIVCYLAVLLHHSCGMQRRHDCIVPLFVRSSPSLSALKEVYRVTQSKLFLHSKKLC